MPNQTMHRPCPEPSRGRKGVVVESRSLFLSSDGSRFSVSVSVFVVRKKGAPTCPGCGGGEERARGAHRSALLPHCRYLVKDDEQRISFIRQSGEGLCRAVQQANQLPLWLCVRGEKAQANALVVMVSILVCFSSC